MQQFFLNHETNNLSVAKLHENESNQHLHMPCAHIRLLWGICTIKVKSYKVDLFKVCQEVLKCSVLL